MKDGGSYNFGVLAHIINKAYSKDLGVYYIDYETQTFLYSIEEVKDWYEYRTGYKSYVCNLNEGHGCPFNIIYRY